MIDKNVKLLIEFVNVTELARNIIESDILNNVRTGRIWEKSNTYQFYSIRFICGYGQVLLSLLSTPLLNIHVNIVLY